MAGDAEVTTLHCSPAEEIANALTHGLGLLLSLAGTVLLLTVSARDGNSLSVASVGVYGMTLVLLFLASTLYHSSRSATRKLAFKLLDHCAIYLLIAGTYTPFLLITLKDSAWGRPLFAIVWVLAGAGIVIKVSFRKRLEAVSVLTYLGMGWLIIVAIGDISAALAPGGLYLLIAGGVIYSLGVLFYVAKRIPFNHAVWHLFVLADSACHFLAVFLYVVPQ